MAVYSVEINKVVKERACHHCDIAHSGLMRHRFSTLGRAGNHSEREMNLK